MNHILTTTLSLLSLSCFGQTYKFRTLEYSVILKDKHAQFICASGWADSKFLVTVNTDEKKVHFYDGDKKDFDVIELGEVWTDAYNDTWYQMECLDKDGKKCVIRERLLNKPEGKEKFMLYIDYSDIGYIYKMKED